MEVRIVPIGEEHIEGFRAVLDRVARERRYLGFLEAPSLEEARSFVLRNIRKGYPQCVALLDQGVIGWCDVLPFERPTLAHGAVLGIGLAPEHRGRGIGKALLLATLERARAAGLTRVELTVRDDNKRAIALYEKLGFVHEGVKRNGVRLDDEYGDLACMALLLDP